MNHLTADSPPVNPDNKQKTKHEALRSEFLAGNYAKVIQLADEALANVYNDSEALFWRAAALYQQKMYKEAIAYASEATYENAFDARYFSLLGLLYLKNHESEYAVLMVDRSLALQPNNLAALEIKAVALTTLFRLQEAHPVIQKMLQLRSEGAVAEQPVFTVDCDPEALYERALTIDPFRSKSRLENLHTIKQQQATYRLLGKVTLADRSKTLIGFLILISFIIAVSYFFRDAATYQSFSPLLFMLLWRGMASGNSMMAATNFKSFFRGDYAQMLQRGDASLAVKGTVYYVVTFAGFAVWHVMHSWIGLIIAIIATSLFAALADDFATGVKAQAVPTRRPKRRRTVIRQLEELPYDDIYRMAMRSLPKQILSSGITSSLFRYGLLAMVAWPVLFMIVRIFTDVLPYSVLLYTEMSLAVFIVLNVSLYRMSSLRYFFPAAARRFVPDAHVKTARLISFLWFMLAASMALHIFLNNPYVLIATGALIVTIFRVSIRKSTPMQESADRKTQLLVYVREQLSTKQGQ